MRSDALDKQSNRPTRIAPHAKMTDLDAAWDEDRGGPTDSRNLISFPTGGDFYKATKAALPWSECGAHYEGRHVVASVFIEKLLRKAPVQDPSTFNTDHFMTKCLDVERYLAPCTVC